jgi:hypothetical protein
MVERYMKECLPGTAYVHLYDGNVKIDNFRSPIGRTPKANLLRFAVFADQLERAGCDLIFLLQPDARATVFAAQVVSVPFIQLDAVILDRRGAFQRIGVINTPYGSYGGRAASGPPAGRQIQLEFSAQSALELFKPEFEARPDRPARRGRLSEQGVDCVLMGQIPFGLMDRKLQDLGLRVPVLYAGREAFQHLRGLLEKRADRPEGLN